MRTILVAVAIAAAALLTRPASALTIFDCRTPFVAAAGLLLTDDYEDPGYAEFQDDAAMNAVKGLTRYETTGFPDFDEVIAFGGEHVYAGGFTSGSFRLDFTAESLGGGGVHSVGFDYANNVQSPYVAFVEFADGTSRNFALQSAPFALPDTPHFFGLVSPVAITSIHIGLADGGATTANLFILDDLSVAAPVPEPGTAALLAMGMAVLTATRRHGSTRARHLTRGRRRNHTSLEGLAWPSDGSDSRSQGVGWE